MRKIVQLFLILILSSTVRSHGQYWNTTGNTTSVGEMIGSVSGNFDLEFYINNVKYLQLLTSGDLNMVAII